MILLLALIGAALFTLGYALDGNASKVSYIASTVALGVAAAVHGFGLA